MGICYLFRIHRGGCLGSGFCVFARFYVFAFYSAIVRVFFAWVASKNLSFKREPAPIHNVSGQQNRGRVLGEQNCSLTPELEIRVAGLLLAGSRGASGQRCHPSFPASKTEGPWRRKELHMGCVARITAVPRSNMRHSFLRLWFANSTPRHEKACHISLW